MEKSKITKRFLDDLSRAALEDKDMKRRIDHILSIKEDNPLLKGIDLQERAMPGFSKYMQNAWWKSMINRYILASYYSKDKRVVDLCCGLGWGSYLVDKDASKVWGIDIDFNTIHAASNLWDNIYFICTDALYTPFFPETMDIVLSMDSLEHFSLADIEKYLNEVYRILKPEGLFIGSTYYPKDRKIANRLKKANPYHLYILTEDEIRQLFIKIFDWFRLAENNQYFIAGKQ